MAQPMEDSEMFSVGNSKPELQGPEAVTQCSCEAPANYGCVRHTLSCQGDAVVRLWGGECVQWTGKPTTHCRVGVLLQGEYHHSKIQIVTK